jgi:hypothetical protein
MDNFGKRLRKVWKSYEIWKRRDDSTRKISAKERTSVLKEAKVHRGS